MARSASVDPLEKIRFLVSMSSNEGSESTALVRVGFRSVQMPKRTTNKISYREGVDPDINQHSPGLTSMEDVVLERGLIIEDTNNEFYKWASAVHRPTGGHESRAAVSTRNPDAAANNYRKDVTVKMLDREGNTARQWTLFQAWPVAFNPGSDLDAGEDGDKALESVTLGYEDFREEQVDSSDELPVSGSLV